MITAVVALAGPVLGIAASLVFHARASDASAAASEGPVEVAASGVPSAAPQAPAPWTAATTQGTADAQVLGALAPVDVTALPVARAAPAAPRPAPKPAPPPLTPPATQPVTPPPSTPPATPPAPRPGGAPGIPTVIDNGF